MTHTGGGDRCGAFGRRALLRACAMLPAMGVWPHWACAQEVRSAADASSPFGSPPRLASDFWSAPRWVWLLRPETGEEIKEVYWYDGALNPQGYHRICWALRDLHMERRLAAADRASAQQPYSPAQSSSNPVGPLSSAIGAGGALHLSLTHPTWYSAARMSLVLLDILYAYSAWLHTFGVARPLRISAGGAFRHPVTNSATEGAAMNSAHIRGGAADIVLPGIDVNSTARFGAWLRGGGVGFYPGRSFVHVDDGKLRSWRG